MEFLNYIFWYWGFWLSRNADFLFHYCCFAFKINFFLLWSGLLKISPVYQSKMLFSNVYMVHNLLFFLVYGVPFLYAPIAERKITHEKYPVCQYLISLWRRFYFHAEKKHISLKNRGLICRARVLTSHVPVKLL